MTDVTIRSDIVEVYVFTQDATPQRNVKLLQLRRAVPPIVGSWQPVMGHIEPGETAVHAGLRELQEETGLTPMTLDDGRGVWQLEAVNTFFMAGLDAIVMSPGLAVQVACDSPVTIDDAHNAHRWVDAAEANASFLWPGQHVAIRQLLEHICPPDGSLREVLRLR